MNILTISGSANKDSSNQKLLKALPALIKQHQFIHFEGLLNFPLFTPEGDKNPPTLIISFRENIRKADLLIISFPEYIHNIPAVLKNALEWITASGELYKKKYCPYPIRHLRQGVNKPCNRCFGPCRRSMPKW